MTIVKLHFTISVESFYVMLNWGGGVYIDNNNTLIHNATAVNCMNW